MLIIYAGKNCEKIAEAIANGASSIETKTTTNPGELSGDINVVCFASFPFLNPLKDIENLTGKKVHLVGIGVSFDEMRRHAETLAKNGAKMGNTLCLKRKGSLPFGGEVGEVELERCRAFGERIARRVTGEKASPFNEKNRIQNYNK